MRQLSEEYVFRDTPAAARRLGLVAEVFDPTSLALLRAVRDGQPDGWRPDLAIDLGCGPGYTTRLLAEALRPRRTLGLDASRAFLEVARANIDGAVGFAEHDVTRVPFPEAPADVVSCRFLLGHLIGHAELLAAWATQLTPGGLLVVEDVEWIRSSHPVLAAYVAAVGKVMAAQGHGLEVGPRLDALPEPAGLRRRTSRVTTLSPPADQAARMFALNLTVWGQGEIAQTLIGQAELTRLATGLDPLARAQEPAQITWGMRQLILEAR